MCYLSTIPLSSRQWFYGSFCIGIYLYLLELTHNKNIAASRDKNNIMFSTKLAMGCTSGSIGSFIGTSTEVVLVRLIDDNKHHPLNIVHISIEEVLTNLRR